MSLCSKPIAIAGTLILAVAARPACALPIVSDGTMADADWSASIIFEDAVGTPTFSAGQVAAGGNPGSYRSVTHNWTGTGNIVVGHVRSGASYDPSAQGAISSIDISFDDRFFDFPGGGASTFAVAVLPMIVQGGTYYQGTYSISTANAWVSRAFIGMTASSFVKSAGAGPLNPDFSSSGSAITFGYLTGNGSGVLNAFSTTTSGVDNYAAVVNQQSAPEPAAALLVTLGLA
jgi:hypothetical protein